jgi:PAS domain S-box-containing protein
MSPTSPFDSSPHLRFVVDHVPSMLSYWSRDLRCQFANRAYGTWFGVDPDRLIGTSLADLLGPELFALNEPYVRAVLQGKEQVFERVVTGPDGTVRQSLATYVPDVVDGEVRGYVAQITEVTPLKDTEAALRAEIVLREQVNERLRKSESALREAQRLGGVGSWEWDVASDTTTWSEQLFRLFGRDPSGRPASYAEHPSLYGAESWARLQAAVSNCLRTGEPYLLELQYVRDDGTSGWLEARGEAVRSASGEITRLRGTVHDVSIRHAAEEARVAARAREAANQHKSELMSRVSHELRTPLNAIMGFAELIQSDDTVPEDPRQWAGTILASGYQMVDLVDVLLELSAAEVGQLVLYPAAVGLQEMLHACLDRHAEPARAAGLTLRWADRPAEPIELWCDAKRVEQVVGSLLSNAIKYTPQGGEVTLSAFDRGGSVDIVVHDTGVGMSQGQLDRIFFPFERLGAENTTTPGAGVGLALSKTLLKLMGGSLTVDSTAGVGSTFVVSLPTGREPPATS